MLPGEKVAVTSPEVTAVIPAAGLSSRMGEFKPLLAIDGQVMIRRTVASVLAGGVQRVCIVLGREGKRVHAALAGLPKAIFVTNAEFATSDMLASVQLGVRALAAGHVRLRENPCHSERSGKQAGRGKEGYRKLQYERGSAGAFTQPDVTEGMAGGVPDTLPELLFVLPGDMPAVKPETFCLLVEKAATSDASVLYPTLDGRRGHPLLMKQGALAAVLAFSGDGGVKAAVAGCVAEAVVTADAGILLDADTPESFVDLENYLTQQ